MTWWQIALAAWVGADLLFVAALAIGNSRPRRHGRRTIYR